MAKTDLFSPIWITTKDFRVLFLYPNIQICALNDLNASMLDMPNLKRRETIGLAKTFSLYVKWPQERYGEIQKAEPIDEAGERKYKELMDQYQMEYFSTGNPVDV